MRSGLENPVRSRRGGYGGLSPTFDQFEPPFWFTNLKKKIKLIKQKLDFPTNFYKKNYK